MSSIYRNMPSSPDRLSEQRADATMMLALMMGSWSRLPGRQLSERTLGLIGFGQVGRSVARRALDGFGMRVLVHSLSATDRAIAEHGGAEWADSIDALLPEADFVSLHCHRGVESHHVIDAHRLNQMKPDAFLINTAHGDLVDEQALVHALWFETIGGAGIGVPRRQLGHLQELLVCDNVIVLPDAGDVAPARRTKAGIGRIDNVIDFAERRRLCSDV